MEVLADDGSGRRWCRPFRVVEVRLTPPIGQITIEAKNMAEISLGYLR